MEMEMEAGGAPARLSLTTGREDQSLFLAYVGLRLIVLSDANHWIALPKPAAP